MRKQTKFHILFMFLLSTLVYWGCKKTETVSVTTAINEGTIKIVKSWIAEQKTNAPLKGKSFIDSFSVMTLWEKGTQTKLTPAKTLLYIPFQTQDMGLAFILDNATSAIDSGSVIVVKSKDLNVHADAVMAYRNYYSKIVLKEPAITPFNGSITTYSVLNRFNYEYGFKNGDIAYYKTLRAKGNESNGRVRTNTVCTFWYYVSVMPDGSETWVFTHSDCDCLTETGVELTSGTVKIRTNCGGDPNGGTPGPATDPACSLTLEEADAYAAETELTAPTTGPTYSANGPSTTDPGTGKIREPYIAQKEIAKFTFALAKSVTYSIFYDAIRYRNSNDSTWKWESVDYITYGQSSGTLPPCYEVQSTCAATQHAVISTDRTRADFAYSFFGWYKITCALGFVQPSPKSIVSGGSFHAASPY